MASRDELSYQRLVVGIAHALFMNRLHLLRLTEVVRLGVRPDEDGDMHLTEELEVEMREQATAYVLTCFPREFTPLIEQAMKDWLQPA
jgi:hypothetical protein